MPLIRKPTAPTPASVTPAADVLRTLTQGSTDERWAAARTAGEVEGGVQALAAALHAEADARVREAIFTSLARVGSPQCVDAIVPLLRVDNASVRTGALDALRAMPAAVRAQLPLLLRDDDSDVRLLSCEIARNLPGDEATSVLCTLLQHEFDANVCAAAVEVLAEVGGPAAIPMLDQCASRFASSSFLIFAIRIARDRILAQSPDQHV